ncbi:MAG: hypothetical protein PHD76_13365 [Methylacidiphilales bacterium]|nr:hypothetical protein [Candidatus Methylacidiphilales bacterium]
MSGINFVVNERGQKTAVVIDLKKHAGVWEDIYDTLLARSRRHEPRETLESVKRRLRQTTHA